MLDRRRPGEPVKHFYNAELSSLNVLKVPVDLDIVGEFRGDVRGPALPAGLAASRPPWSSDIQWISATTPEQFERFERAFDRLGIAAHVAPYLDLDREVRFYAGFIVTRRVCSKPDFHRDWEKTNNEAFTLITPVSSNAAGFGLLYHKIDGEIAEYDYKPGEAIVFGDHFIHSTKPGESEEPVVLLSFTFGTDKMVHWSKIYQNAGYQSFLVRQPDGELVRGEP